MENFKEILTQQKEALTKDIEVVGNDIITVELKLDEMREIRKKLYQHLRGIEKKLEKM